MHGLGYLDPRAASKACNADCANNPIAATCKDSGLEVYAQECNYDTGKAVTCNCRKPRITKTEGPPIRIAPHGGGYGGIIPRRAGISGLSERLPGRMAANAWCANKMSCLNGRKPIATNIKNTWEMTNDDCTCLPQSVSYASGITPSFSVPANRGVSGLNESFIESLGNLANLAILGLAIYGGYCLSKKF